MNRISILLVVLLALVVTACASEEAASASPSEAPATVQPTPEPEESQEAAASEPTGSGLALPSFDLNGDPELAARFPDTVGGQPLQVQSMRGDQMGAFGGTDPTFQEFLDSVGAELSDVSFAFGAVMSAETTFTVTAFRILGASEGDLEREFLAASEGAGDISGLEDASVGGKDVLAGVDPSGDSTLQFYLYTKDDTLYVLTGSEEHATEVLEALP